MSDWPECPERLRKVVRFFEELAPPDLDRLSDLYAPTACFKDPFNDVQGIEPIRRIFEHMFATLEQPRFVVTECIAQGERAFVVWEFHFRSRRFQSERWQTIRGGTHLAFDATGRVILHRDYWDAAEELYEKLPLVGRLMRWLRRRASDR